MNYYIAAAVVLVIAAIIITIVLVMKNNVNPLPPVKPQTIPTKTTGLLKGPNDGPYQPNLNPDVCIPDPRGVQQKYKQYGNIYGPVYLDKDRQTCIFELLDNKKNTVSCDDYCQGSYLLPGIGGDGYTGAKYVYDPNTGVVLDLDVKKPYDIDVSCGCF